MLSLISIAAFRDELEKVARANLLPVMRELAEQGSRQSHRLLAPKKKKPKPVPTKAA